MNGDEMGSLFQGGLSGLQTWVQTPNSPRIGAGGPIPPRRERLLESALISPSEGFLHLSITC